MSVKVKANRKPRTISHEIDLKLDIKIAITKANSGQLFTKCMYKIKEVNYNYQNNNPRIKVLWTYSYSQGPRHRGGGAVF